MSNRQAELTRKLADKFHLSVLEKAELEGAKIRWSEFVKAVATSLRRAAASARR